MSGRLSRQQDATTNQGHSQPIHDQSLVNSSLITSDLMGANHTLEVSLEYIYEPIYQMSHKQEWEWE